MAEKSERGVWPMPLKRSNEFHPSVTPEPTTASVVQSALLVAAAGALALALPCAQAQVVDLSDAINKAGRQRMLSQRMGKAWLALRFL
jgi:hypothetical protein